MKRIFVMLCLMGALAACGDGYNEGSDKGINAPPTESRVDTTNLYDTTSYERATNPRDSM